MADLRGSSAGRSAIRRGPSPAAENSPGPHFNSHCHTVARALSPRRTGCSPQAFEAREASARRHSERIRVEYVRDPRLSTLVFARFAGKTHRPSFVLTLRYTDIAATITIALTSAAGLAATLGGSQGVSASPPPSRFPHSISLSRPPLRHCRLPRFLCRSPTLAISLALDSSRHAVRPTLASTFHSVSPGR